MSAGLELHAHRFTAMGGPCGLQGYAAAEPKAAFRAAEAEVRRLEAKYSRYKDDSVVSRINRSASGGAPVTVDEETAHLLDFARTAWQQSDGAFDITTGALRRAWDFNARRVPAQAELDAALAHVGWQKVSWENPRIALAPGMELDFGGFVKEYAADIAATALRQSGIAHGLVDMAGDLAIVGPHPDGKPWLVGIQHPRDTTRAIATLELPGGAIASSGDYERYFEADGRRYCHILDARTGWPVKGIASVSVVADQCLVAGAASTIAMLKGREAGPRWLAELGLAHLCIAPDGSVIK